MATEAHVEWNEAPDPKRPDLVEFCKGVITKEYDQDGTPLLLRFNPERTYTPAEIVGRKIILRLTDQLTPAIENLIKESGFPVTWSQETTL